VRGVNGRWVRSLYLFALLPTQAFYFSVTLDLALRRILSGRSKLKHYEAGMDLALHADPSESYKLFQLRLLTEYETIVQEHGLTVMDATLSVEKQQRRLRDAIRGALPRPRRGARPRA
jgi:dTMP kinase